MSQGRALSLLSIWSKPRGSHAADPADPMSNLLWAIVVAFASILAYLLYDPYPELRRIPSASPFARTSLWLRLQELQGKEVATIHGLHSRLGPLIRVSPNAISVATDSAQLRNIHTRTALAKKSAQYEDMLITFHRPIFALSDAREHGARRAGFGKAYSPAAQQLGTDESLLTKLLEAMDGQLVDVVDIFWGPVLQSNQRLLFGSAQAFPEFSSYEEICRFRKGETIGYGSPVERLRFLSLLPFWLSRRLRSRIPRTRGAQWVENGCKFAERARQDNTPCGRMQRHLRAAMESATPNGKLSSWQEKVLRERVRDEMIDQLTGGADFPLSVLTCALSLLARPENCHWQERIREPGEETINAVVSEVLRLYPPAAGSQPRELLQAINLPHGSTSINLQPGVIVHAQPFTLHRSEQTFTDPEAFAPERWLSGGNAKVGNLWAFGKGPTHCIAQEFAMLATKAMLKTACEKARFEVGESSDLAPAQGLLLSPEGVKVRVQLLA